MKTLTEPEIAAALNTLVANGLTFGDCVKAFAASSASELIYAAAAHEHGRDGELEIDKPTVVSESDDGGAYVMAWLWVSDADIWEGPTDSDGEPCRFINRYTCTDCDETWEDQWSCACNDKCPVCNHEIEPDPFGSIELGLDGNPIEQPKEG